MFMQEVISNITVILTFPNENGLHQYIPHIQIVSRYFFKFIDSIGSVCGSKKNIYSRIRKPKCQKLTWQICVSCSNQMKHILNILSTYNFSKPLQHMAWYVGFESKASGRDLQPLLFCVDAVTIRLQLVLLLLTVAAVNHHSVWRVIMESCAAPQQGHLFCR